VAGLSVPDKVYDGSPAATLSGLASALQGVLSGDTVTLNPGSASATFTDKNAGQSKTVNLSGLSLTGSDAGNYTLSGAPGALTASITPKTVSASGISAASKVYDATSTAAVSGGSLLGTLANDSVSLSGASGSFANKNVGTAKTVNVSVGTLSGTDAGNYLLASSSLTTTADITARGITVAGLSVPDKVYDGSPAATLSGLASALQGVLSGDTVTLNPGSATATFTDKNAGQSKTVNLSGLSLTGSDAGNYTLSGAPGALTASITPKTVSASGISAASKVYDGNVQARLTGVATLIGVLDQDNVSLDLPSATAVFLDRNAGPAKLVNVSSLALNGTDASNYKLTIPTSLAASITPRVLSLTFSNPSKVYDGNTSATTSITARDDRIQGDTLTLAFAAAYADRNVGTKTVTISDIRLSGADASNYTGPTTAAASGIITQRPQATWTATSSGNWSNAANWDALPDGNNVATVVIPATAGLQVTFDLSSLNLTALSNAATLVVSGGSLKLEELTNTGSLVVASALNLSGVQVSGAGSLNNQGQLTLAGSTLAPALTNSGTVLASGSNTLASVVSTGIFNVASGSTQVTGAFTQTGGTTTLGAVGASASTLGAGTGATVSGGRFQGTGTVSGNLNVSNAVIAPGFSPGTLSVQGNLVLGAGAILEIELAGSGTDAYDRILATGTLQLGGQLLLSSLDGFRPATGQTFQILSSQGVASGRMTNVTTAGTSLEALQIGNLVLTSAAGSSTVPTESTTLVNPAIEAEIAKSLTTSPTTSTATATAVAASPVASALSSAVAASTLTTAATRTLTPPAYVVPAPVPAPAPVTTPVPSPAPTPGTTSPALVAAPNSTKAPSPTPAPPTNTTGLSSPSPSPAPSPATSRSPATETSPSPSPSPAASSGQAPAAESSTAEEKNETAASPSPASSPAPGPSPAPAPTTAATISAAKAAESAAQDATAVPNPAPAVPTVRTAAVKSIELDPAPTPAPASTSSKATVEVSYAKPDQSKAKESKDPDKNNDKGTSKGKDC
jgi:hypothetical protein